MSLSGILMNVFYVYLCMLTTFKFLLDDSTAFQILNFKTYLKDFIKDDVLHFISGHILVLIPGVYVYAKENKKNCRAILANIHN